MILLKLTGLLRVKQLITRPLLSAHARTHVQRTRHVRAITSSDRFLEDDLTWSFKNSPGWNGSSKECLSVPIQLLRNRTMPRQTLKWLYFSEEDKLALILYIGNEWSNSEKGFGNRVRARGRELGLIMYRSDRVLGCWSDKSCITFLARLYRGRFDMLTLCMRLICRGRREGEGSNASYSHDNRRVSQLTISTERPVWNETLEGPL